MQKLFSNPLPYDLRNYKAKIIGDDIAVSWINPPSYKHVKLYGHIDGAFKYFGQMPKGTTSHTVDPTPGKANPEIRGKNATGPVHIEMCPAGVKYKLFSPWENIKLFYDLE